jgi:hypothetical protein
MIQKNKDSGKIKFLEDVQPIKEAVKKEESKAGLTPQPAQKMDNSKAIETRGDKFLSAGMGIVTNFGGPKKQLKSVTANSIWDTQIIDRMIETPDNGERIKKDAETAAKIKKDMADERIKSMVDSLKTTDLRKDATIAKAGEYAGSSNYKRPYTSMSILDIQEGKNDFNRIPEKTEGEKITERVKEAKNKAKEPLRSNTISTSKILNNMIDNIIGKSNDK